MTDSHTWEHAKGAICGLTAAALFGLSIPLAKLLLPASSPLLIAALFYLGAGSGLVVFELFSQRSKENVQREARLRASDTWLLLGIIIMGGILGPFLMLTGLERVSAVLGSLLLNLEAPFTIGLAVVLFKEHFGWREASGALLIITAAAVLGYHPEESRVDLVGLLALSGACLAWGIDNNLTQQLSLRDPVVVTRIKTLAAGSCMLGLAMLTGNSLPRPAILLGTLAIGVVSYGVSLVLDMYALRLLGAAREAAFFATAPFMGALAAIPIVGDRWGSNDFVAASFMVVGVFLLLWAHHSHQHTHEQMLHDHVHVHLDHHEHDHDEAVLPLEPHAHVHRHLSLTHDHPHVSELHHRHEHR